MALSSLIPKTAKNIIREAFQKRFPDNITCNFRTIDSPGIEKITRALKKYYFSQPQFQNSDAHLSYLDTDEGKKDFQDHLFSRLEKDRERIIPWLNSARDLNGAHILEIGCGTGSSTVALAEQGASVSAVDVDELSIEVAKERCKVFELNVDFLKVNATEVHKLFQKEKFDFIIFFASLEHMTLEERLAAMHNTWDMLPKGGMWCIIETPNRLWYHDGHTSKLPFYFWLPDDLALQYSQFSARKRFNEIANSGIAITRMLDFYRWGRGVSYHEFDLALGKTERLKVISSLKSFLRAEDPFWWYKKRASKEYRFEVVLKEIGPPIHEGFYQSWLDLVIEKN